MERKGKDVTCGQVWCPILAHFTIQVHTQQSVVNTDPEQWAAILLRRSGSSWGFDDLLKGLTSVMVLRAEESRALVIHSTHLQTLLVPRLEPTMFMNTIVQKNILLKVGLGDFCFVLFL